MPDNPTFAEVIGANAKALRGPHSMDEVASTARTTGINWSSGNVSAIENGRARPSIQNLLVISYALGQLNARAVSPIELMAHDGRINVGVGDTTTTTERLDEWWRIGTSPLMSPPVTDDEFAEFAGSMKRGTEILEQDAPPGMTFGDLRDAQHRTTLGDERIARSLDLGAAVFRLWSERTWGRGFEDERDTRAGDGATAQKKGRISRTMKDELREQIRGQG